MSLQIYEDIEQGSDPWLEARRGMITASVVAQMITPKTVKVAHNDTARGAIASLVAERITGHVEETYMSRDMEMGVICEPIARDLYSQHYKPVSEVGFMVRDYESGVQIGYSPDGLVGDDGLIEVKTRRPKKHIQTIVADEVPLENMAQLQTGLLVSGREWIDYISFSGGLPLWTKRVLPDPTWQDAIYEAAAEFEKAAHQMTEHFMSATSHLPETERVDLLDEEILI